MLVCHCRAVNEDVVRDAIAAGAADEFDVAAACGAGSVCGGCVPTVTRILGECAGCPVAASAGRGARALMDAGGAHPLR